MNITQPAIVLTLVLAAGSASAQKASPAEPATPPATAPATPAGLVMASDPAGVLAAMQAEGFVASLGVDDAGDPMISGVIDGTNYEVYFYGCQAGANCQSLLFSAGYDLPDGTTPQAINEWNASKLVGQAYLDETLDPFVNYFVSTTGGLTSENFADVLDWWKITLPDFEQAIGY